MCLYSKILKCQVSGARAVGLQWRPSEIRLQIKIWEQCVGNTYSVLRCPCTTSENHHISVTGQKPFRTLSRLRVCALLKIPWWRLNVEQQ